jgi:hypothetical protein
LLLALGSKFRVALSVQLADLVINHRTIRFDKVIDQTKRVGSIVVHEPETWLEACCDHGSGQCSANDGIAIIEHGIDP